MVVVVVEVWAKVYAMEVEAEWMVDLSVENPILSAEKHSVVKSILLPRHHSKEVQSNDYTLFLILHDF